MRCPMNREDIIRMAREAGAMPIRGEPKQLAIVTNLMIERFAALVAAAEREACAKKSGEFARKWWSIHCASNKHLDTTRKAHDDFCDLQAAIRARGNGV